MNNRLSALFCTAPCLAVALQMSYLSFAAQAETLKGEVKEKSADTSQPSRLQRTTPGASADPFSSGDTGMSRPSRNATSAKDAPEDKFSPTAAANPPEAFSDNNSPANAGQTKQRPGGNPRVRPVGALPDNQFNNTAPVRKQTPHPQNFHGAAPHVDNSAAAADPDKTHEMQLLWDAWHESVARTIYSRFNRIASIRFKSHTPLLCKVSYVVRRDATVDDIKILQSSANPAFDDLVVSVIKSMSHSGPVQFPRHSQRQSVERTGTFRLNETANKGFVYQKGDKEQIRN